MRNDGLEAFATTINNIDNRLPAGTSRCFNIGTWGGCGTECPAFLDGECEAIEDTLKELKEEDEEEYERLKEEGFYKEDFKLIEE